MHNTWWYKTYEFFRYDIWRFFKNIWSFRRELYEFQWWDSSFNLRLFKRSLELTKYNIEKYGMEENISRMKKVAAMNRVIELLNHHCESDSIDQAEKILGIETYFDPNNFLNGDETPEQKANNTKIFDLATKLEEEQWHEIWSILEGSYMDKVVYNEDNSSNFDEVFNGSDMRGWWD